jgi:HSP20 family protein
MSDSPETTATAGPGDRPGPPARTDWFDRWTDSFPLRMPEFFGPRFADRFGFGHEGEPIRIEESVDDDGLTIRCELPGLDPDEDVEVTVDNGRLSISAERRQETKQEEDEGRVRSEFRYGSYRRTISLPAGADSEAITATYDDGILAIRVPVDENGKEAARIPIGRAG